MADKAINCRATAGYVTDGAGQTYCLPTDVYPVTRGGQTFGLNTTISDGGRDRSLTVDVRLAGQIHATNNGTQYTLRVDLDETGLHNITLAIGDATTAQGYQYVELYDNATLITTIDDTTGTAAGGFDDANGTEWTAANWPGSNTKLQHNFTSTILNITFGAPAAQLNSTTIAHVATTYTGGGGGGFLTKNYWWDSY